MKLPSTKSQRRTPLFYLIAGFLTGVIIARNADGMAYPSKGAVFLGCGLAIWAAFRSGKRANAEAAATAVAIATATAISEAKATANATAQQAVQVILQSSDMPSGERQVLASRIFSQIENDEEITSSSSTVNDEDYQEEFA